MSTTYELLDELSITEHSNKFTIHCTDESAILRDLNVDQLKKIRDNLDMVIDYFEDNSSAEEDLLFLVGNGKVVEAMQSTGARWGRKYRVSKAYLAVDSSGDVYLYSHKPVLEEGAFGNTWHYGETGREACSLKPLGFISSEEAETYKHVIIELDIEDYLNA